MSVSASVTCEVAGMAMERWDDSFERERERSEVLVGGRVVVCQRREDSGEGSARRRRR